MTRCALALSTLLLAACTAPPLAAAPPGRIWPGEIVVKLRAAMPPDEREAWVARHGGCYLEGTDCLRVRVPEGAERAYAGRFAALGEVAFSEPNFRLSHQSLGPPRYRLRYAPNDQGYGASSPLQSQAALWGLRAIRAESAWDRGAGEPQVKIAILDTGCDMAHPDLSANLDQANARDMTAPERPMSDEFGHGTHVAGIVAALGDNRIGTVGVAWRCQVLPIRVLGADGTGSSFHVASAIDYALSRGARVINMSLGSPDASTLEAEAIERALAAGAVVVAAAGNEATIGNPLEYPAALPGVLAVGAVGPDLQRAPFSNFNSALSLAAPGVDVLSTIPHRWGAEPYGYMSGTSMAAPFVAGAAALLFSWHPDWTGKQVAAQLLAQARDLSAPGDLPGYDVYFGHGLLDLGGAP